MDMENARWSRAVRLQQMVDELTSKTFVVEIIEATSFDVVASDEGAPPPSMLPLSQASNLLLALPNMVVFARLEGALQDCLQKVFADVAAGCCLADLKVPTDALSGDSPAGKLIESCVRCSADVADPAGAWLRSDAGDSAWPGASPVELACSILRQLAMRDTSTGVSPFLQEAERTAEAVVSDLSSLEVVLRMFEVAGKVGRLLAWVHLKFLQTRSDPMVHNAMVNASLQKALVAASGYLQVAQKMVSNGATAAADVGCFAWQLPVDRFDHWVTCAHTAFRAVCGKVIASVVEQLQAESMALLKVVPSYEHLMNGPKLNLTLAAKHLVGWPSKKQLGTGCIALERGIKEAAKAHSCFGFEGTLRDDAVHSGCFAQIESNYKTAKAALATIAAVNCLTSLAGAERLAKRDSVLKNKEILPKLLVKALEGLK